MLNWLYHGSDRHQCYYRPSCILCYLRVFFALFRIRKQLSRKGVQR